LALGAALTASAIIPQDAKNKLNALGFEYSVQAFFDWRDEKGIALR